VSVILGINAHHADSAACLVIDGRLIGAVAEERLGPRIKHSSAFPLQSIKYLLTLGGITLKDVTHIAVAKDSNANLTAKVKYSLGNASKSLGAIKEHLSRRKREFKGLESLAELLGEDPKACAYKLVNVEHHLAHVSSAYYLSNFDSSAGFSYDGSGDFASMLAAKCEGNKIELIDKVLLPNSLGFFYTAMCQYIGFDRFGEEYKVMGLAPYGEDKYHDFMQEAVELPNNQWFETSKKYFGMHSGGQSGESDVKGEVLMGRFFNDSLEQRLGQKRDRKDQITQREMDLARSTQVRFEEAALNCMNTLSSKVQSNNLSMAGGCALNGVANARIHRETVFKNQFIQPAASDDGTCLGAAFWCLHNVVKHDERFHMQHAFWGPEYSDQHCLKVAHTSDFFVEEYTSNNSTIKKAAELLAEGKVIGWYQGRSEWGPRALGNRSILANPAELHMKDTINQKIKRRESFRPFAPSVLKHRLNDFFDQDVISPFMQHVIPFKESWKAKLPAVCHVDGTGRAQTVEKDSNPMYFNLITEFEKLTGIGMLLNTSFNENEPVVDTPEQALDCFHRTDMDALFLRNCFLIKQ